MANPIVVDRIARRLRERAEGTPTGAGFWETLAELAANEATRTVTIATAPLPAELYLAVVPDSTPKVIARAEVLADLQPTIETYLQRRGDGTVWAVEIKRVITAS